MVERDLLEQRAHAALIPTDTNDAAQFGQMTETAKDAIVEQIRQFFNQPSLAATEAERRREIPTVRKYGEGYGPGTDPYATTQQIVQDWSQLNERLPHLAVTSVQGRDDPMTAGQPFLAHVQNPPRVESANAEPYALGGAFFEQRSVTVTAAVVGAVYTVSLNGQDFSTTGLAGDTTQTIAARLNDELRVVEPFIDVTLLGSVLTATHSEVNVAFTLAVGANLATAVVQAAGTAATDVLVFRTTPSRLETVPVEEIITFNPDRFPTASPASAATAADVVRVFNEQAQNARAVTYTLPGGGTGVRLLTGGLSGKGKRTPNEIEILSGTSDNLLSALGLGTRTTGAGADALTGTPPDTVMTLSATGIGTAALAAAATTTGVTAYLQLSGASSAANNGRFEILSVPGADSITIQNTAGVAESLVGASWFIGYRDSWRNTLRPVCNRRYASASLTVSVSALTESTTTRTELQDLIYTQFAYYLESQHFEIIGRGVLDYDNYPDEVYQISLSKGLEKSGHSMVGRPNDNEKGQIHEGRVTIPLRLTWCQDRAVLVTSGPRVGQSWVITAADVILTEAAIPLNGDF